MPPVPKEWIGRLTHVDSVEGSGPPHTCLQRSWCYHCHCSCCWPLFCCYCCRLCCRRRDAPFLLQCRTSCEEHLAVNPKLLSPLNPRLNLNSLILILASHRPRAFQSCSNWCLSSSLTLYLRLQLPCCLIAVRVELGARFRLTCCFARKSAYESMYRGLSRPKLSSKLEIWNAWRPCHGPQKAPFLVQQHKTLCECACGYRHIVDTDANTLGLPVRSVCLSIGRRCCFKERL